MKNIFTILKKFAFSSKLLLFLIMAISLLSFNTNQSYSQEEIDWEKHTPSPCEFVGNNWRGAWIGPKLDTVCFAESGTFCCFTVVYYDRMWESTVSTSNPSCPINKYYQYDLNITGIFFDDVNCSNFNKDSIVSKFQNQRFIKNSQRKGFRDSLLNCCGTSQNQFTWVTAKCVDSIGNDCEYAPNRCCRIQKTVHYDRVPPCTTSYKGIGTVESTDLMGTNCSEGCTPACNGLIMQHIPITTCDFECNYEPWINMSVNVPFDPACPTCIITVKYSYRETQSCNPNYFDFVLDSIIFDNENCDPCLPNGYDILTPFAITQMLSQFTINQDWLPGTCIGNIRISKAPCFGVFFNSPGQDYVGECVPSEDCCLAILKICKNSQGIILPPELTYNNITNSDTCDVPMLWCKTFCFDEMFASGSIDLNSKVNQINSINQAYLIKPNPAKTYIDLTINNDEKGNFILNIYNQLGAIIKSEILHKNKLLQSYIIDVRSLNNGNYNLVIMHNNNKVFKSLINIEK